MIEREMGFLKYQSILWKTFYFLVSCLDCGRRFHYEQVNEPKHCPTMFQEETKRGNEWFSQSSDLNIVKCW